MARHDDLAARVAEIALAVKFADVPRSLRADSVYSSDEVSVCGGVRGRGADWNQDEARGCGLFFRTVTERMARLEESRQDGQRVWSVVGMQYDGMNYLLARTHNSPQSLSRPHPPILIGGAGGRKTLLLVARYADACNIFDSPELAHKLDVLREHCSTEGRDYSRSRRTFRCGSTWANTVSWSRRRSNIYSGNQLKCRS